MDVSSQVDRHQSMMRKPLFAEPMDWLVDIPHVSQEDQREHYAASPDRYLHAYLAYYHLTYVIDGLARNHDIWQSDIYHYRIVEQRWRAASPLVSRIKLYLSCMVIWIIQDYLLH